ncbi:START domain-containing protein [Chitinophaga vietnamensis]|uniref:START domain-containing protein n=1 Tax=Chitinophaga vietnamensis TaxID=2593957 RepID=UPI0013764ABB|nr:START domain-containing protein [Chitinophaga vietnamensis]
MERLRTSMISCIWLLLPLLAESAGVDTFRLVKKDAVIALYERWISTGSGDKVREIKAVFQVKTNVAAVIGLFKDQQKGREWNINACEYRIIPSNDTSSWLTYIRYNIPWPMDDQDACLHYHYQSSGTQSEVAFESATNSRFPVQHNTTRITGTRGKWIMEEQGAGTLQVTYLVTTDRNKKVPRWIADPVIHDHLFKTMTRFKSLLENHYYGSH